MKSLFLCAGLLIMMGACTDMNSNTQATIDRLKGENFQLHITRAAASPDVQFPMDELEETDYSAFTGEKFYTVSFSDDGKTVLVEPGSIIGERMSNSTLNKTVYQLHEGVFAGGRFVVWPKNEKIHAELTIYGSGVPILFSERGDLLQE